MSGFVAVASRHPDLEHPVHLKTMSQQIAHRGDIVTAEVFSAHGACDARYRDKSGFRVDTYSDDEFAIVIDGLIFNQGRLARDIGADNSVSVAQVILDGFRKFGDDWFVKLDGSFALMITDLRSGDIILVRDRFAHRPMYFGHFAGNTWVANEIKALLEAPNHRRELNKDRLPSNITNGFTMGPQTLFSGIYKCVPGFVIKIDANGNQSYEDYFRPANDINHSLGMDDAKEFVLSAVSRNVQHFVDACPDVGVTWSGGMDSALLAHLTNNISNGTVRAVNFGATSWPEDESGAAGDLANRIGMKFACTMVSPQDDLLGSLRRIIWAMEEPTRFENSIAFEMMSRDSVGHCKALMTGEGADFMFGDRAHLNARRLSRILQIPGFLRAILRSLPLEKMPVTQLQIFARFLEFQSTRNWMDNSSANCSEIVPGLTSVPENPIGPMLATDMSDLTPEMQYSFITLRDSAPCWVERLEKVTAAAGLECFQGYETNDVLNFCLSLPPNLMNQGRVTKPVIRALATDIFDHSVAHGKKKQLAVPFMLWLNESEQLREAVLKLKSPDSRMREYLDNDAVDKYLDIYEREGAPDTSVAVPIFRMLTFEIWLDLFF
jgi:asparagine synthase (glutamine-hydrolysing)